MPEQGVPFKDWKQNAKASEVLMCSANHRGCQRRADC